MIRATLAALMLASPAMADETWWSEWGQIIYEAERGEDAIFSFINFDGYVATLIIPGLAGNYTNRGVHDAYWLGQGEPLCPASLSAPDGTTSTQWGPARVSFDFAAFPTGYTLELGECFQPLTYMLRAEVPN